MKLKVTIIPNRKRDYKLVRLCVPDNFNVSKLTTENSNLFKLFQKMYPISLEFGPSQYFDMDTRERKIALYLINDFKDDYDAIENILGSEDILGQIEVNLMVREILRGKTKN